MYFLIWFVIMQVLISFGLILYGPMPLVVLMTLTSMIVRSLRRFSKQRREMNGLLPNQVIIVICTQR